MELNGDVRARAQDGHPRPIALLRAALLPGTKKTPKRYLGRTARPTAWADGRTWVIGFHYNSGNNFAWFNFTPVKKDRPGSYKTRLTGSYSGAKEYFLVRCNHPHQSHAVKALPKKHKYFKSVAPALTLAWLALTPFTAAAAEAGDEAAAKTPEPHWSHMPIWGVEAEARGFQIPLPFGVGVNYYHENQPFNINDLKVAVRGRHPVSVKDFAVIDRVDTEQHSAVVRLDTWIFPFLNLYGVAGHTAGEMNGTIGLPGIPVLGIAAQTLPLSIGYEGPTYGGGATLAGGFKVSDWRGLTLFAVADANYTITDLDFTDERLFTDTKATALVFSTRLGLRTRISENMHGAIWAGAMYQNVSDQLVGRSADSSFAFLVVQGPVAPWNTVIGARLEMGRHFDCMIEGGVGTRTSILGGLTFRF